MTRRRPPTRIEEAEAIWALAARVLAFFLGVGILAYETLADHGQSSALILAGIGLTGVPIAGVAERLLDRLPGGEK